MPLNRNPFTPFQIKLLESIRAKLIEIRNPEEAVLAHKELNSTHSVGIHFGTFQLTYEAIDQPVIDLEMALREHGVPEEEFRVMAVGEHWHLPGAAAGDIEAAVAAR